MLLNRLVLQLSGEELTVKTRDMCDRDRLGALRLTSTRIGTVTKAELIHLRNHSLSTTCTLNAALRQLCK